MDFLEAGEVIGGEGLALHLGAEYSQYGNVYLRARFSRVLRSLRERWIVNGLTLGIDSKPRSRRRSLGAR